MDDDPLRDETDRKIAGLVLEGRSNKFIARALGIPLGTVKSRLHRIYRRLGVDSRTQFLIAMRAPQEPGHEL